MNTECTKEDEQPSKHTSYLHRIQKKLEMEKTDEERSRSVSPWTPGNHGSHARSEWVRKRSLRGAPRAERAQPRACRRANAHTTPRFGEITVQSQWDVNNWEPPRSHAATGRAINRLTLLSIPRLNRCPLSRVFRQVIPVIYRTKPQIKSVVIALPVGIRYSCPCSRARCFMPGVGLFLIGGDHPPPPVG